MSASHPYYREDLARVHHLGFGFHADLCAPGVLELLAPIKERDGLVLELGCGSGLLTRFLVDAGHRVVATDASLAMLDIARETTPGAQELSQLTLPDDPLPQADAIVSIGHAISYLPDEAAIDRALAAIAEALLPGGVMAFDICDLEWGSVRVDAPDMGRVGDDWAIISRFSTPEPHLFVRDMTTFLRNDDDTWRRDDEHHDNVLIDTSRIPGLFAHHGVEAVVGSSFGSELLPVGLKVVTGYRPA